MVEKLSFDKYFKFYLNKIFITTEDLVTICNE